MYDHRGAFWDRPSILFLPSLLRLQLELHNTSSVCLVHACVLCFYIVSSFFVHSAMYKDLNSPKMAFATKKCNEVLKLKCTTCTIASELYTVAILSSISVGRAK